MKIIKKICNNCIKIAENSSGGCKTMNMKSLKVENEELKERLRIQAGDIDYLRSYILQLERTIEELRQRKRPDERER